MKGSQETKAETVNGINVGQLFSTIDQIGQTPEVAKFKFRTQNQWIDGTHSSATVTGFYGALREDDSRPPAEFQLDEPPVLLGKNQGMNPVEYLLVALSGCLTTSMIAHAAAKGIEIKGVQSRYEGDIDLRGFLGLSEDVPVGFQSIRVYFKIDADIPDEAKNELIQMAQKYSPVFNTIANPVSVSVQLDK
ncbi:MAG: OsmC family peroxiredoxin [Desulfobacteraceae bacterium]|nr:MAG: OsmC family peroxiredoxin [Desulfobacteraceae bacterium]